MFIENEEDNELEEELVVTDGVPETPEEDEQIENSASEEVEEVQDTTQEVENTSEEDIEKLIEERANKLVEEKIQKRLNRDRNRREREEAPQRAKYEKLTNILKTALGAKDIDDVITKSEEYYKEQGIIIPDSTSPTYRSEREEKILAEADAGEIIELGRTEMEEEANRIARIPEEQRSIRDKIIFNKICTKLISISDEETLKSKGYDSKILNDKEFSDFREQFNINVPIDHIYETYQKVKGIKRVQPHSPGSAKTNKSNNEIKEYYTPEEAKKFTEEELDNPKLMAALEKSMQLWGKNQ